MWNGQKLFNYVVREVYSERHHVRSHNVELNCPSCHGERKFAVDVNRGLYACFTCPLSGSLASTITMTGENRSKWSRVRDSLGGILGVAPSPDRTTPSVAPGTPEDGPFLPFWPVSGYSGGTPHIPPSPEPSPGQRDRVQQYLLSRGLTSDDITLYRVGVLRHIPRVYFPYWNASGQMTYWMGRGINKLVHPKTLEPGFGNTKPLFGKHVQSWTSGPLLLTEGVFDHIATPNSFALLGSAINVDQIRQIEEMGVPWVCVVFDPDATYKAQWVCEKLQKRGIPCGYVRWVGTQKDPADLGRETMSGVWNKIANHSTPNRITEIRLHVSSPMPIPGDLARSPEWHKSSAR